MNILFLSWKKLVAASCFFAAFFLEAQAQSEPSVEELETARIWLAKFNYNLTIDEVRKLKKVNLTAGTDESVNALSAENMKNLRVLTNLESLTLNPPGDDAWVAEAAGLSKLRSFMIDPASNLTDRSAEIIGKWQKLEVLRVNGFKITDEGFRHLVRLRYLEVLEINYAKVSDPSLAILRKFPRLTTLSMSFTNITDVGLPYLYDMRNLRYLNIQSSKLTVRAMLRLRQALPHCIIVE